MKLIFNRTPLKSYCKKEINFEYKINLEFKFFNLIVLQFNRTAINEINI